MKISHINTLNSNLNINLPIVMEDHGTKEKTKEIAKKTFQTPLFLIKIQGCFKKAIKWLKSIPNQITKVFKRTVPSNQTLQISDPLEKPLPQSLINSQIPKEKEELKKPNLPQETSEPIPAQENNEVVSIPQTHEIIRTADNTAKELEKRIENLEKEENKEVLEEQLKAGLNAIQEIKNPSGRAKPKIEQLRNKLIALQNKLKEQFIGKTPEKPIEVEEAKTRELIEALVMPPGFKNEYNNCWFHSSMEFLWAWNPYFSNLIKAKFEKMMELHEKNMPLKHDYPQDPKILIKALYDFNVAMEAGNRDLMGSIADKIQFYTRLLHPDDLAEFGEQQDSATFLQFILNFLTEKINDDGTIEQRFFLNHLTARKGLNGQDHLKQIYQPQGLHIVQLPMNGKSNFQELLNENFSLHEVNDPKNPVPIGGCQIHHFLEQDRLKSIGASLPEFIFVQVKRFEYPTLEEKQRAREELKTLQRSMILERAKQIQETPPPEGYDRETLLDALQQLRAEGVWPELEEGPKKIETFLNFSENHVVNFGRPFGEENAKNPDYDYVLKGTIIHSGGMDFAHYTANIMATNPETGKDQWCHCNDINASITPISEQEALKSNGNGYLFYFEKVQKKASK